MLKRIILWVVGILVVVAGGIITYIYYNQDLLKERLIIAMNKRLKVPAAVGHISISALSTFPDATVVFSNVKIADPHKKNESFLTASQIGFSFNIWDLLSGKMVLEEININNGTVNIIQYAPEKWSYQIYHEDGEIETEQFSLDIKNISITQVDATYLSELSKTNWKGHITNTDASIQVQGPVTWITVDTDITSGILKIKEFVTLQNQQVLTEAELVIDEHWRISTSLLKIGDSFFNINISKDHSQIAGNFKAEDASIQTILSLTPADYKKRLANYTSKGNISLNSDFSYTFETGKKQVSGDLIFNKVTIAQQSPAINLSELDLSGNIYIPDLNETSNAYLKLSGIKGKMNGEPLSGDLYLKNFDDPSIKATYKGTMPLAFLRDIADLPLKEPSGKLDIDLAVEGTLSAFSNSMKSISSSGEINLHNLQFYLPNRTYLVEASSGTALLTDDHLAINELELQMGKSHFRVNGEIRNFWNMNLKDKNWSAKADIQSRSLMLDELLSVVDANPKSKTYAFHIPGNINLELKATVDKLQVRQFKANRVAGNLLVRNKMFQAERLSFESMGGLVKLKGEWQDLQESGSLINVSFLFAGINADSLFQSFENFNQDFITDKNLSGEIYAEAETSLRLDSSLIFLPDHLNAILKTRIINGELRDFKPLYSMEQYLDNADLSIVKFSELENQIYVQNQTIHLPMMAVGTNIIKFKIGGTHTFDQHIDYDVIAPLNRKKRTDSDERFGTVADDQHGESLIFLSVIGTTADFEVSLDKQAIKAEIASDVKREVKELQDAFKNNGKTTTSEVVLEEDEYFDWDN